MQVSFLKCSLDLIGIYQEESFIILHERFWQSLTHIVRKSELEDVQLCLDYGKVGRWELSNQRLAMAFDRTRNHEDLEQNYCG